MLPTLPSVGCCILQIFDLATNNVFLVLFPMVIFLTNFFCPQKIQQNIKGRMFPQKPILLKVLIVVVKFNIFLFFLLWCCRKSVLLLEYHLFFFEKELLPKMFLQQQCCFHLQTIPYKKCVSFPILFSRYFFI